MNPLFPNWYHNTGIEVSADELKRRWQAVESFSKKLKIDQALDVIRLFNGARVDEFTERFGSTIQKLDPTFRIYKNQHELRLLAGAVIADTLKAREPSTANDVTALATLVSHCCGLVSNDTGMEELILGAAKEYLDKEAIRVRRTKLLEFEGASVEITQGIEQFKQVFTQPPLAPLKDPFSALIALLDKEFAAHSSQLEKLEYQFRVQQEESNMAWWVLGQYSRDLEQPFAAYDVSAVSIIAGKELAAMTEFMPGPRSAPALLNHVLYSGDERREGPVSLKDAINATPKEWRKHVISNVQFQRVSDLCPVHLAIASSIEGDAWTRNFNSRAQIKAAQTFKPLDLSLQTYQECLLIKAVEKN